MDQKTYYFPWIRKGMSTLIQENDTLGKITDEKDLAKRRPVLSVNADFAMTPPPPDKDSKKEITTEEEATIPVTETKEVEFISPGDIISINTNAILKVVPAANSEGFATQYYPYIEFWEPDFPWRYTPAKPIKEENKLRPWLALLVCEQSLCTIYRRNDGNPYVRFNVNNDEQYKKIFISPAETWKTAHAQGSTGEEAELSRLIALRRIIDEKDFKEEDEDALKEDTNYYAFLVPAFETGRLRGLGYGYDDGMLDNIVAQLPAWEDTLEEQKKKHPNDSLDFPIYYSWSFKTGGDSFDGLVQKLSIVDVNDPENPIKASNPVDVTRMGEGLDYNLFDHPPERKVIGIPAATKTLNYEQGPPFPSPDNDESEIFKNMEALIKMSPVFEENQSEISKNRKPVDVGVDDPWVTPPVYGAKHYMATSLEPEPNGENEWLRQLNLDIHYRAAAGLGKKTVQIHQEELVNRAWKQVEVINELNQALRQCQMSVNVNKMLRGKTRKLFKDKNNKFSSRKFISGMMRNFSSMKHATAGDIEDTTLEKILAAANIPKSFATASFQNMTDDLAKFVTEMNAANIMDKIANDQIFRMKEHGITNIPSIAQLRETTDNIFLVLLDKICEKLSKYFFIEKKEGLSSNNLDELYQFWTKEIVDTIQQAISQFNNTPFPYTPNAVSEKDYEYFGYFIGKNGSSFQPSALSNQISTPSILIIDDNEYKYLFGSGGKLISAVAGYKKSGYYSYFKDYLYFISKNRIPELLELKKPGTDEKIVSFYRYFMIPGWASSGGGAAGPPQVVYQEGYEESPASYDNEKKRILTPVAFTINLSVNTYPELVQYEFVQYFHSMGEYAEFLKKNPDIANSYLHEWLQLDNCVKKLEQTLAAKKKAEAEEEEKGEEVEEAVEELQEAFDHSEAYERMREVAENYYTTFFSDKELMRKYINDLLQSKYPLLAYPIFPEPVYHYLKMFSDKFILPCVDVLPDDSVAVFNSNEEFTEAYLCGMNTEMGKELLWREYPTDQRGSYFRKFWDSETRIEDITDDNFFDVKPLDQWTGALGTNHAESKTGLFLFAIKGKLMRQYPTTQVFLQKAVKDKTGNIVFDNSDGSMVSPIICAYIREDILLAGFKGKFENFLGDPNKPDYGYFLTFLEDVQDLNFEYNEGAEKEKFEKADNAASVADVLRNDPSLFGKHLSLFLV